MTLVEFQGRLFSEKSVFDRKDFDFVTNLVKWLAIRVAYILFKIGMTANALDVASVFLALGGFFLIHSAIHGHRILPLLGIAVLYFHVFVDFVDGAIAKARGESSRIGHHLDSLGCDLDRFALILLFGLFSGNPYLLIASGCAGCIFINFLPLVRFELPETGLVARIKNIYCNKFSFLSVRFMLWIFPLLLSLIIINGWNLPAISHWLAYFYSLAAAGWLILCIPNYAKRDKSNSTKESPHVN